MKIPPMHFLVSSSLMYLVLPLFISAQVNEVSTAKIAIAPPSNQDSDAKITSSVLSFDEMRGVYGSGFAGKYVGVQVTVTNKGAGTLLISDVMANITLPGKEPFYSAVDQHTVERTLQTEAPKNRKRWRAALELGVTLGTALAGVLDAGSSSVAAVAIGGMSAQRTVEAVVPDRSSDELLRMCDTILRPGLVPPQSPISGVVFIPIDLPLNKSEQQQYRKDPHSILPELYRRVHISVTAQTLTLQPGTPNPTKK